jgi:hypothetical protein
LSDQTDLRARLLLSVQRALLGEVTSNMRAVTCSAGRSKIDLRWIIDGDVSDELKDALSAIGAEVIADFPSHRICGEVVRCDAPSDIKALYLDELVYLRKE